MDSNVIVNNFKCFFAKKTKKHSDRESIWSNKRRYEIHKIHKKRISDVKMKFLLVSLGYDF